LTRAGATLRGGKVFVESVGASSRRRFASPATPRSWPAERATPRRGRERSGLPKCGTQHIGGEFAVGIMEDRLIAQPVDCFASAGGGVCLGPFRVADSDVEAAIPNPRNRAAMWLSQSWSRIVSRPAVLGPLVGNSARVQYRSACSLSQLTALSLVGKVFFVRGGSPRTARKPRL